MLRLVYLAIVVSVVTGDPLRFLPFGWGGGSEDSEGPASNVCPDKQGTCPDGSTCCLLNTGKYGCCPYQNAVCCSDLVHCCPNGFTCDVQQQMCLAANGATSFDWMMKVEPIKEERDEDGDIVCPGKQYTCPSGDTCCKEKSGEYGCCPLEGAVCCSDGVHCCPNGYKCDVAQSTCTKSQADIHVTWISMLKARQNGKKEVDTLPAKPESTVTCPDGNMQCTSDQTCCEVSSNVYACCPLAKAVCCEDKVHCCPEGSKCNVAAGMCEKAGLPSTPMVKKVSAKNINQVVCPDNASFCPDGATCCQLPSGQYGCCPLTNAVCCDDQLHCCPEGSKCQVSKSACLRGKISIPWSEKTSAITHNTMDEVIIADGSVMEVDRVNCPDQSYCPDQFTCCSLPDATYGCCPNPNAVCCSDHLHCCPQDYTCDLAQGTCTKGDLSIPLLVKTWAVKDESTDKVEVSNNVVSKATIDCPDKKTTCPDSATCCEMADGSYGCCPFKDASCCSDHIHCCPKGEKCDVEKSSCDSGHVSLPWHEKIPASPKLQATSIGNDIKCPDNISTCPQGTTCCVMQSGYYGCCPQPNAVCCSDKLHCCPEGSTCDVNEGTCNNGILSIPWSQKLQVTTSNDDIKCPDNISTCPQGTTCCEMQSGYYGCCPQPNAVCCSDKLHCCPEGSTCDVNEGTCKNGLLSIPWSQKIQATTSSDDIKCPDNISTCPQGTTCCEMQSGYYGCCPQPNAVCCSDKLHCCPEGSTCDVTEGTCNKGELSIPWNHKLPAKIQITPITAPNTCPDKKTMCPQGTTCCLMNDGYGCCPLENAVCCDDKQHCCPSGHTCDSSKGTCDNGGTSIQWLQKIFGTPVTAQTTCPDDKSTCPSGTTCCEMQDGNYGCCPMENAVCCSDKLHCCPDGSTCDVEHGSCNNGASSTRWLQKLSATPVTAQTACPDDKSTCPSGTTCCEMQDGNYGCCPMENAVCCSDKLHCCPEGSTCDVNAGSCKNGKLSISWAEKLPSNPVTAQITCPDQKGTCPDGNTCCLMNNGEYGCCPLKNAVCCSDHIHCCPSGYTCDSTSQQCNPNNKGDVAIPSFTKTAARKAITAQIECPDGKGTCPDGSTCCLMNDGDYGCCPLKDAVCCSDHTHCCPSGYTCDTASQQCNPNNKDDVSIPAVQKIPTQTLTTAVSVSNTCPDDKSECPSGTTCCQMQSGDYGCCPMNNAVCCSDKLHCCPEGSKCDVSEGTCDDGILTISWSLKTSANPITVNKLGAGTVCPDGKSTCSGDQTCCTMNNGEYGCCPYKEAVCCDDHVSCCPNGYTCDSSKQQCNPNSKDDKPIPWSTKLTATKLGAGTVCPDGKSTCSGDQTCCTMNNGEYGCCPYKEAVCCDDHVSCCPNGYTCDSSKQQCNPNNKDDKPIPWSTKLTATKLGAGTVCPDGKSTCSGDQTCCTMNNGEYGCCPYKEAVCCDDHVSCCPNGYTCDSSKKQCDPNNKDDKPIPWSTKLPATKLGVGTVCPDGKSTCSGDQTCCTMNNVEYGCCPYKDAVCCDDHVSCCPNGYTCDSSKQQCNPNNKDDKPIPWSTKLPATKLDVGTVCPDGKSTCSGDQTCCTMNNGEYGCCPYKEAVCCDDHVSCCPNGYTCDSSKQQCNPDNKDNKLIPWSTKLTGTKVGAGTLCPDGASTCPVDYTCCTMTNGQFGCCPLKAAVCCPDHIHCCPNGYTCDTSAQACNPNNPVTSFLTPKAEYTGFGFILPSEVSRKSNICLGGEGECEEGMTCCETGDNTGCCPHENGICCSDGHSCCPAESECALNGRCQHKSSSLSISSSGLRKPGVITMTRAVENVVCKDKTQCPDDYTCCEMPNGNFGCCPQANAVCCADKKHCCPAGYTCDGQTSSCTKGDMPVTNNLIKHITMPWLEKQAAFSGPPTPYGSVMCPDRLHYCPDRTTCCKLKTGEWGCCPFSDAVCCSDGEHCCPRSFTCDATLGKCHKRGTYYP